VDDDSRLRERKKREDLVPGGELMESRSTRGFTKRGGLIFPLKK